MVNELQRKTLLQNGINPEAFSNLEELLGVIDDSIVKNIVNNDDEPDRNGIALQRIYDQLRRAGNGEDE